jgi:hypothetical protein
MRTKHAFVLGCVERFGPSSPVPWRLMQKQLRESSCSASSAVRAAILADATDDVSVPGAQHNQWENAVSKVIGTPELLELILSHLLARNLISSTRVSKTFRHLIHTSPTLLRNTFLLNQKDSAETISRIACDETDSQDSRKCNGEVRRYTVAKLCPLLHMSWPS